LTIRNPEAEVLAETLARLTGETTLDRLETNGRIIPARLDLIELGPPPDVPREMTLSEALEQQRRDD
jgi:hypothetical protein